MYGSIMRARLKPGRRAEYERMMRDVVPVHAAEARGLHSAELAYEAGDPDRILMIIRFRDKESYLRNAEDPRTDADSRRQLEFFEGEPEWIDVDYGVYVGKPVSEGAGAAT